MARALLVALAAAGAILGGAHAWPRLRRPKEEPRPPPSLADRAHQAFADHVLRQSAASAALERPLVCSVAAEAALLQAAVIAVILALGLLDFELRRRRFIRRVRTMEQHNPFAFIAPRLSFLRHSFQSRLPGVTVVMPCKGVHAQSYQNWKSQVASLYGGALEFIFVVESEKDPAYAKARELQSEMRMTDIKVVVAGLSFHCSQKIHNQVVGIDHASRKSTYLIILDDDIRLHPGTILAWVAEMEADPSVFVASGYSFDWVPRECMTLPTQLVMMWRMMAMAAFANTRPSNLWGGAMMFRREELHRNVHSIIDAWRDGGYSEDLITIALCRKHRRHIAMPLAAIFPNRQAQPIPFPRYWNYMCRQVYVLLTYAFPYHKFVALEMQAVLVVQNLAAVLATAVSLAVWGRLLLGAAVAAAGPGEGQTPGEAAWAAAEAFGPTCGRTALFSLVHVASCLAQAWAFKRCIRCLADLCNTLSPPGAARDPALRAEPPVEVSHVSAWGLALVQVLHNVLVLAGYLRVRLDRSIVWSGVNFTTTDGRIMRIDRRDDQGGWYSVPRDVTLEESLRASTRQAAARLQASLG